MEFKDYLKILVQNDGSDLYLTVDAPPVAKFQGILKPLENVKLTQARIKEIAYSLMDDDQHKAFEHVPEHQVRYS
jgi:twitching motility protein PilU